MELYTVDSYYGEGHIIQLLHRILHQWYCCNTQFVAFYHINGWPWTLSSWARAWLTTLGKNPPKHGRSYQVQLAPIPPYQPGAVDPPWAKAPHQWCYPPLPEGSDGPQSRSLKLLKVAVWGAHDACSSSNHHWMCILQPLDIRNPLKPVTSHLGCRF